VHSWGLPSIRVRLSFTIFEAKQIEAKPLSYSVSLTSRYGWKVEKDRERERKEEKTTEGTEEAASTQTERKEKLLRSLPRFRATSVYGGAVHVRVEKKIR